MRKLPVGRAAPLIEAASPVLLDWPGGLHRWLATLGGGEPSGAGVRGAFGPQLRRMLASLKEAGFPFLHRELRDWLARWEGGRVKPWSPLYIDRPEGAPLTAADAAQGLGVSKGRIPRLVASALLPARTVRGGGRLFRMFQSTDIAALRARCAAAVTATEAARQLGVTPGQARRIVRAGLLEALRNPPGRTPGTYVEPSAVTEFGRRLDAACSGRASEGPSLADLAGRGHAALVGTLLAAARGKVELLALSKAPGAPTLARYAVPATLAAGATEATMTVREAARALAVHPRMIPALVGAGCLTVSASPGQTLTRRAVRAASVAAFPAVYATSGTLAAARGTSTRSLIRRLEAAGVRPVVAPDPRRGLSSVWRLADCP
ncbi:hypothetical protein [Roseomonas xinghualingensis]|uniref:hypothetical protein n=1 Tax=Roseomonas xinghualingensis TaxID=2986475 RepID=UPI0021F24D5E|nr:hypothetical protein [Roseomonas sp. SXEYE001]MCV4209750.1 hypothetical protein [Roseomonas sp. SXEYE001]